LSLDPIVISVKHATERQRAASPGERCTRKRDPREHSPVSRRLRLDDAASESIDNIEDALRASDIEGQHQVNGAQLSVVGTT
jgi:hypothetical protein